MVSLFLAKKCRAVVGTMFRMAASYAGASEYADQIEQELRKMNVWQSEPPPASAFESTRPFYGDTMSFYQWLQFVLLPRIRTVVAEQGSFPGRSQVGVYAVRELDGQDEAADLISLLSRFDRFIETAR
jgi:uncharacterized protein YqcC (DUF446 family)